MSRCTPRCCFAFAAALPSGCESSPATIEAIRKAVHGRDSTNLALSVQHPNDPFVHQAARTHLASWDRPKMAELSAAYARQSAERSGDWFVHYLAALYDVLGSPASIRHLERAKAIAPDSPAPYLILARALQHSDPNRAASNIGTFFELCPGTTTGLAYEILALTGPDEVRQKAAGALRSRLAGSTDPAILRAFASLWMIESRTNPEKRFQLIDDDIRRLERIHPTTPAILLMMVTRLIPHVPPAGVDYFWRRLVNEFPESVEALTARQALWSSQLKLPSHEGSRDIWNMHFVNAAATFRSWMKLHPDAPYLLNSVVEQQLGRDYIPAAEAVSDAHSLLDYIDQWMSPYDHEGRAKAFRQAGELLLHADQPVEARAAFDRAAETANNEQIAEIDRLRLVTLRLSPDPGSLRRVAESVNKGASTVDDVSNLARLAELECRMGDALKLYRMALDLRREPPPMRAGRRLDPLRDDAARLYAAAGWDLPPVRVAVKLRPPGPQWKTENLPLPAFDLTDLSGRVWSLAELRGKAVLINVWASWCGPCRRELPELMRLWNDSLRHRSDVAVLTFNIDADGRAMARFVDEHKLGFPVVAAADYVKKIPESSAIPQTWIVDAHGRLRWRLVGFGGWEPAWEHELVSRLDQARAPQ